MGARVLGGRYRLVERLGHGGMSVVWLGYDEVLGRPVAVKLLTPRFAAHAPSADRIRTEARAAARLSHPNVTAVHDYGEAVTATGAPMPYVVMELLTGRTLSDRLKEGPLPLPAALLVCAQVAGALAAAHTAGLVHRDVKPSNVMLTPAGVKVLDFGLAAPAGTATESILDGEVLGTPAYLAPERLIAGEVLPASDVYGLGLLLYASVTGGLPWRAETVTEMLSAHWYVEPAPLPAAVGLPRGVRALYQRCLAKDPQQRPTAQEMAAGLAEATVRRRHGRSWAAAAVSSTSPLPSAGRLAVRAPVPASAAPASAHPTRWGAVALAGSAAVVVAALAGGLLVPVDDGILPVPPAPGVAADDPASPSPADGFARSLSARDAEQLGVPGPPGQEEMIPLSSTDDIGATRGGVAPEVSGSDPDGADPDAAGSDGSGSDTSGSDGSGSDGSGSDGSGSDGSGSGATDPGVEDPAPSDPPSSPPVNPSPDPAPSPDPVTNDPPSTTPPATGQTEPAQTELPAPTEPAPTG